MNTLLIHQNFTGQYNFTSLIPLIPTAKIPKHKLVDSENSYFNTRNHGVGLALLRYEVPR